MKKPLGRRGKNFCINLTPEEHEDLRACAERLEMSRHAVAKNMVLAGIGIIKGDMEAEEKNE
jgi:hypothetical protein